MSANRSAALAVFALLGGCIEMETQSWTTAYVTDDPMPPEARADLSLAQQPGIYYEYPIWVDYKYGNDAWEAGYVWASLTYLPLVPPFNRYGKGAMDTDHFSDLVEGVEPLAVLLERIVGKDDQKKTRWIDWISNIQPGTAFSAQTGMDKTRIPLDYDELARRHARSPAHIPLRASLGDREVWAVGDRVWFLNNYLDTVELYFLNPVESNPPPKPSAVWITARGLRSQNGEMKWFTRNASIPYLLEDRLYVLSKVERRLDGALAAFEARPWEGMPVDLLLDGADSEACIPPRFVGPGMDIAAAQRLSQLRVRLETSFNEKLIEWKAAELPKLLSRAKPEDHTKLSVRLEKSLLKLDLKVKQIKDAVDEDARQTDPQAPRKAPMNALDRAHLLDQRKTILTVILGAVKRAASAPQQ